MFGIPTTTNYGTYYIRGGGGGKIIERSHFLVGRQAAKATVIYF